jgi:hypothetical protein
MLKQGHTSYKSNQSFKMKILWGKKSHKLIQGPLFQKTRSQITGLSKHYLDKTLTSHSSFLMELKLGQLSNIEKLIQERAENIRLA